MTDDKDENHIADQFRGLLPYLIAFGSVVTAVWALANGSSQLQATQVYQGQEIAQLVKAQTDEQTLSYSISTQLAQLTQSVADIKANTAK